MDQIILQPYSEEWPVLFQNTAINIRKSLGDTAVRIDHIGSTSIPNLAAKPVIDIQISVKSFEPIEDFLYPLQELGYIYRKDNPDKAKRYFREKPGDRRTHIHVRKLGSWHQQFSLLFRDYLRTHPIESKLYENENIRPAYVEGKNMIFWDIMFRADRWASSIGWEPKKSDI